MNNQNNEDWRANTALLVVAARTRAGISQAELARRSGVRQSTLCKIERKGTPMSMHNLYRIAFALDCSAHELVPPKSADAVRGLKRYWDETE